jgi:hypothetical protein
MIIKFNSTIRLAVVAGALFSTVARADRRDFTHVYEYQTMPAHGLDLELWNTQTLATFDATAASEVKIETEYGITDHWDMALYQIFSQDPNGPIAYDATSLETRYRFAERGAWPVDVLVYLELDKSIAEKTLEVEGKIILAKDLGPVTIAANAVSELVLFTGDPYVNPAWALGASWEIRPEIHLGAEFFGEVTNGRETADGKIAIPAAVGPTISLSPSDQWFITVNGAFGVTQPAPKFQVQFDLGIHL